MLTRDEQKAKRQKEIIYAGLDLFVARGFSAVKTIDIANKVGVSSGLMFKYFPTKESLYKELISIGLSESKVLYVSKPEDPWDYIVDAVDMFLNSIKNLCQKESNNKALKFFLLLAQAFFNEDTPESVSYILKKYNIVYLSISYIKECQKNNTVKQGDPTALAFLFWGSMIGFGQMALRGNKKFIIPHKDWFLDILRP